MAGLLIKDIPSFTQVFLKHLNKGFDKPLQNIKILSIGDGNLQAEIKVTEEHTNPMGTMHGAFSTLLVDSVSSWSLASKVPLPHVSVDLHMTFLKGGNVGDDLLIDVKTIRAGKTLAFLEVLIKNKSTGDLLVKGAHTKYIPPRK